MSTPGMGARELHGLPPFDHGFGESEPLPTPQFPTRLSASHHAIAGEVLSELHRAMGKFPPMNSMHEGYAILLEEVDELWDEVKANRPERALEEACQVAAMAIRFIHDAKASRRAVTE